MGVVIPPLYIQLITQIGDNIEFETIPFEPQLMLYGEDSLLI